MTEPDKPSSLEDFDARLQAARDKRDAAKGQRRDQPRSGMGLAFRLGIEMVSALAVGVGIGWLLDEWLGTRPWLMILFFFLGSAAGILNVIRVASGQGSAVGFKKPGNGEQTPSDG